MNTEIGQVLRECIRRVIGTYQMTQEKENSFKALGGEAVQQDNQGGLRDTLSYVFQSISASEGSTGLENDQTTAMLQEFQELENLFANYYSGSSERVHLEEQVQKLRTSSSEEEQAECITKIFLPELRIPKEQILQNWKLTRVQPNPKPYKPNEVVLQLNALYSEPTEIPLELEGSLQKEWERVRVLEEPKLADYDHPVPIFEKDENHELIKCLEEMDHDVAFEKSVGVLESDYKVPVLISISVTHRKLDTLCGNWLEKLLADKHYEHLRCMVLSETRVMEFKKSLFQTDFPLFTVLGKYATHFNALKYSQLLLEKAYGIRAGFKLDTDEGIRSKDLYEATGKTWFQTMCHPLWGGTAYDSEGNQVYLGVNEGEYVNKKDIDALGYKGAMRAPDVNIPSSYQSSEIFFNKAFAHGMCTAMYNQYDNLEQHISHPVVKGGGYGISNEGLRKVAPFTFSQVGRAEDQQFYFCSLVGGCRGVFQPDLRIAHYKGEGGAVHKAEQATVATRFIGDMFRLVIFSHLVDILPEVFGKDSVVDTQGLKREIDPMPGVFAGKLARLQAFLNLLYKAYSFCVAGKEHLAEVLIEEGLPQLRQLKQDIDSGAIKEALKEERKAWRSFIAEVEGLDSEKVRTFFDSAMV